jgi:hypothetical protein
VRINKTGAGAENREQHEHFSFDIPETTDFMSVVFQSQPTDLNKKTSGALRARTKREDSR